MEFKTDALMLKGIPYKDNDMILTLFSHDRGKLTASAKGVKKAGAKLKFAAQPFCFAEYVLVEKAGRHTVIQAGLIDSFYELRNAMDKFYAGFAVTEFCDGAAVEGSGYAELFMLAVSCLKELCYGTASARQTLIGFLLNALSVTGYSLNFSYCGVCGNARLQDETFFDFERGAVTCGDCRSGKRLSASTYAVIKNVLENGGEKGLEHMTGEQIKEGEVRALKLLSASIYEKTGAEIKSLGDLIAL